MLACYKAGSLYTLHCIGALVVCPQPIMCSLFCCTPVIRPPGTISSGRAYILPQMFLFCFATGSPSSVDRSPWNFATWSKYDWILYIDFKNSGGGPPKKLRAKTCKISVNFGPLQTLIANISGTAQDIHNRKTLQTMAIPPAFNEKSPVNFGPLTAWNYMWVWTH